MVDLVIESMNAAGEGVGRTIKNRVVFVPKAMPGDRVRVEIEETRKGVQYARLVEVLEPSANRVTGRCTASACGACALKHVAFDAQGRIKRARVVETMRRIGKIDVDQQLGETEQTGDGWRYRHRVHLHAAVVGGEWRLGYFAPRSHDLVPLEGCPVLRRSLETVAASLARELVKLPQKAALQTVDIAYSRRDDRFAARLVGDGPMLEYRRSLAWLEDAGISGVDVVARDSRWQHGNLALRYDHTRAEDFALIFEPGLFTQAHPEMNDRLVETVAKLVRPQSEPRMIELHSGIGNFTVPLARRGARVTAIEQVRRAAVLCRRNVRAAGVPAEVRDARDVDVADELGDYDLVLLDPPRTGAPVVAEAMARRGPPRVVYVSCDVATLARDASRLLKGGYQLTHIGALDMFPCTPHVEVVAAFDRPSPAP